MASFDPYHQWLSIPPDEQPPSPYRLLGLRPGETDEAVIEAALGRQTTFVRQFQTGPHAEAASRILNEIAEAGETLLDPRRRAALLARLRPPERETRDQPSKPRPRRRRPETRERPVRPPRLPAVRDDRPLPPREVMRRREERRQRKGCNARSDRSPAFLACALGLLVLLGVAWAIRSLPGRSEPNWRLALNADGTGAGDPPLGRYRVRLRAGDDDDMATFEFGDDRRVRHEDRTVGRLVLRDRRMVVAFDDAGDGEVVLDDVADDWFAGIRTWPDGRTAKWFAHRIDPPSADAMPDAANAAARSPATAGCSSAPWKASRTARCAAGTTRRSPAGRRASGTATAPPRSRPKARCWPPRAVHAIPRPSASSMTSWSFGRPRPAGGAG